ncbi:MAG TPA: hypothetical protein VK733_00580 [Gemmatimonadaceae bacterium]|jgi:hypothetical protein|nr:hypothetical protein [Gemmatimonadaceae bacterium]
MVCQFRYGTLAIATLLAIACGDASNPGAPQSSAGSALARHMDSLVVAAKSNPRDSLWAATIEGAEYVPAYGGTPTSVTVSTDSGTQTWQALILEEASPGADTAYFLWAYSDTAFTKVLITGARDVPNVIPGIVSLLILNDTTVVSSIGYAVVTTTSVGGSCTFTSGLVNITNTFAAGSCNLGTFTGALHIAFGGDSIAIAAQPMAGVILK